MTPSCSCLAALTVRVIWPAFASGASFCVTLTDLLKRGRKRDAESEERGLSATTVHTTRAILRAVLAYAEKLGVVSRNVAKLVSPPRGRRFRPTILVKAQFEQFIEAAFGERLGVAMLVALALGLRIGESLGLRWDDIDLDAGTLRVSFALQRVKDENSGQASLVLEEPKSERSRRTLPVPAVVIGWLKRHKGRQAQERLLAGKNGAATSGSGLCREWHGMVRFCDRYGNAD